MRTKLSLVLALGLSACQTTEPKKEPVDTSNLDISMEKTADAKLRSSVAKSPAPNTVDAFTVIPWRDYFKNSVGKGDRTKLSAKLQQWKDEGTSKSWIEKGRMHVALGREKEAEAAFLEAIRKDPKNLDANLEMAGISLRLRKMNQAFDFLAETKKLMSAEEENSVGLVFRYRQMLAMAYLARQEYKSAHRIFSDLIALDHDFVPAYVALAQSYLAQERIQTAEFIAKRGLDRSQKDPSLINILGIVALRKGQQMEARRFFDDAIQLQPSFAQARLNRASLAIQNGEFEAAEQDVKKALEDAPGVVDGYVTQAVLFRKTGRIQGAKEALNTALEMQPEHAVARYNLALLYAESLSDVASAKRLLAEVSAMDATPSQIKKSADLYLEMLQNAQLQQQ